MEVLDSFLGESHLDSDKAIRPKLTQWIPSALHFSYHYLWSYTAQVVGTPEQIERDNKRYTEGNFLIGGAVNPRDSDLTVTEAANGTDIVFNGRKAFSTGSKVSDLTVLEGVLKVRSIP